MVLNLFMNFILSCPYCNEKLFYNKQEMVFFCLKDNNVYFVVDDIPVMLINFL